MIGPDRPPSQHHLRFVRCLASLDVIAPNAGADQIFPRILPAAAFWHDVIDGQRNARSTAILAAVAIAAEDILSRKDHFFEGNSNIRRKPDNARKRHRDGSRMHRLARHTRH